MIRSAVLVSGKGTKLQSLLDSVFFGEIPELQLVAVISSDQQIDGQLVDQQFTKHANPSFLEETTIFFRELQEAFVFLKEFQRKNAVSSAYRSTVSKFCAARSAARQLPRA